MKKILSPIVFLTLALFFIVACQQAANNSATANVKNSTAPKVDGHGHTDSAPRISLADAKKDFDAGDALFVDTRASGSYETEHIKGAINISGNELEAKISQLKTDKKIIAYCS